MNSIAHDVKKYKLGNGLTVVTVPVAGTAAVTAIVLVGVGSRFESDQQRGLAHFTEHMVFKGGKEFPNTQAIAQTLDAIGGEFNAFTSQELTGFYTKTASDYLETGLKVLSDMILHPQFPADELEKEKGVIVEEINMYEDMPMRKVDWALSELIYGDTPLGRPIVGNKESVTSFNRNDFVAYRDSAYCANRTVLVVAGALDDEQVLSLSDRYFAEMPSGDAQKPRAAVFQERRGVERVNIVRKDSEQSHMILAVEGLALGHPDRFVLRMLNIILGGNMSSRLFVAVREEKGLCYYVRSSLETFTDAGLLTASAGIDNNRIHDAVKAIVEEMQKMRVEKVGEDELNRAKQYVIGKLTLSLEDSEQVADLYGTQQLLSGETENLDWVRDQFLSVTAEQIQQMAQRLFVTDKMRLAIIGPQDDQEGLAALLKFE